MGIMYKGRSIYADKMNQKVSSSSLSIHDDGTIKGGLNSSRVMVRNTSQKTVIVDDGVLRNFIYDLKTAKKGNTKSTGNGMRSS